jgi:hypothetical protein
MNTNGNSAKSLIEILSLCAETLAAFDPSNGTQDSHLVPVKARVPAPRLYDHSSRHFTLIQGGRNQQTRDGIVD